MAEAEEFSTEIEAINVDLNCDLRCEVCEKFFACHYEKKWDMVKRGRMAMAREVMSQIKYKVAVASGKGGVGKSTITANLACALAMKGYQVSVLDHDFDGACIPKLFGCTGQRLKLGPRGIIPLEGLLGIQIISTGLITRANDVLIWFHEMRRNATEEFLSHVDYGKRDFLLVDLPPGTSSDSVNLLEYIPDIAGIVVVTVPSELSQLVAKKTILLARQAGARVFGVVENMSGFVCPDCNKEFHILRKGGGKALADEMGVPFLGYIPLDPEVSLKSDEGVPYVYAYQDSIPAQRLLAVADFVEKEVMPHGEPR